MHDQRMAIEPKRSEYHNVMAVVTVESNRVLETRRGDFALTLDSPFLMVFGHGLDVMVTLRCFLISELKSTDKAATLCFVVKDADEEEELVKRIVITLGEEQVSVSLVMYVAHWLNANKLTWMFLRPSIKEISFDGAKCTLFCKNFLKTKLVISTHPELVNIMISQFNKKNKESKQKPLDLEDYDLQIQHDKDGIHICMSKMEASCFRSTKREVQLDVTKCSDPDQALVWILTAWASNNRLQCIQAEPEPDDPSRYVDLRSEANDTSEGD